MEDEAVRLFAALSAEDRRAVLEWFERVTCLIERAPKLETSPCAQDQAGDTEP